MKIGRILIGVVGSAFIATSAIAADLPQAPPPVVAPPPMAAPAFSWGGMYFGVFASSLGIELGGHVGFNVERGRMVYGIEAGAGYALAGAFTAFVKGRAGFAVGERILLYGMAGIEGVLGPNQVIWIAGGGAEFAINNRLSLFAEAGAIGPLIPPACCGLIVRGGINIHR